MDHDQNKEASVPYMRVESDSETNCFELEANSNVLVGTGGHCKIQLVGENINSLHCILALNEDGSLQVQDWNTGTTIVNGDPISETTVLKSGDLLQVGDYKISPVLSEEEHEAPADSASEEQGSNYQSDTDADSVDDDETSNDNGEALQMSTGQSDADDAAEPVAMESLYDIDDVEMDQVEQAKGSSDENGFVYDIDADFNDDGSAWAPGFEEPNFVNEDSIDSDEVQLLRLEVAQLKYELAQRDCEPAQLDLLNREQTERLVGRLEELLLELKRSDERMQEMESLLRDSDQAARHEKEERQHMEKWISELENRVDQRENESEAELEQLKKQLEEARLSHAASDEKLRQVIEDKTGDCESVPSRILDQLKDQVSSLKEQLEFSQAESEELREKLTNEANGTQSDDELREAEQKLAEMQLEAARERAEISRQRADLKRLKADLEERLEQPREKNNADTRIRAMREHLMELHDQEQEEKSKRKEAGLAGRISKLLNRVGRQ